MNNKRLEIGKKRVKSERNNRLTLDWSSQTEGMSKRYTALANQCRSVNPSVDLATFVRSVTGAQQAINVPFNKFAFVPPRNPTPGALVSAQHDMVSSITLFIS